MTLPYCSLQPVLSRGLGWAMEAMGDFRYPPYKEEKLHTIRAITQNR